ncbi:MAG: DUF262 domain-containing protein [Achromobacter sp.]|uniref:DUF262 domain-containing protein n=1 Tax=Achromobacter sp. TaxID=134375 RepID=UPI0029AE44E2|nr:DUF262 domain-containing protein [Achromobacter sp.]MDX3987840.1 DUF262 domain-containing protein [Achromobacter sp.]
MSIEVVMGDADQESDAVQPEQGQEHVEPDEFFAKNAFRIIYQTNNFFLPQLRDLIDRGEVLNLRPEYQRRLRWTPVQKSRLIESLLLNIPVPPVFLYESEAARYEVMDGQQRLNAVREFLAGEFALTALTVLKPLNGLRYSKCPPRIKRALDRASLSAIVLLLESGPDKSAGQLSFTDIRRIIFDRLNTGGTKLNPQEIRNALNPGNFNQVIIELTRYDLFADVFDIPRYSESDPGQYYENQSRQKNQLFATMGDCQLILRYFALKEEDNIRGSMKAMLDRAMQAQISAEEVEPFKREFQERFSFLYELFEGKPFLLPADGKGRTRVSAAMYDSSMVAINNLWNRRSEITADAVEVRRRLSDALGASEQQAILTGQGNTAKAVKERIALMTNIFIKG